MNATGGRMFGAILPKKTQFFDLFSRHAALTVEGAHMLQALLSDLHNVEEQAQRIKSIESDADKVAHQTLEMLHRSFITPIERGDIHRIVSRIDDILDYIEAASQRLWLYEIKEATPEAKEMSRVLVHSSEAVKATVDALHDLRDPARIRNACIEINRLENECDTLLRLATARLFREERDAVMVLKWKEIYENIEDATDRCEDVANVIEGVVIENA
jgi:predicted phosphate transport protein (TIGR00153 family)